MGKKQSREKDPHVPMRRCAGCMQSRPQREMVRIAYYEGVLTVDADGKAKGRGMYICPTSECIGKAIKNKALNRAFKKKFSDEELNSIFESIDQLKQQQTGGNRTEGEVS